MKRKLNIIYLLAMLSVTGMVMFQVYWSINAYKMNKRKFDSDIDIAMQRAIDACKKDYFDSIRVVLTKRLSPPETTITIDTPRKQGDTSTVNYIIKLFDGPTSVFFNTTKDELDIYKRKLGRDAGMPRLLTEMSFYKPEVLEQIKLLLGMYDTFHHMNKLTSFLKAHKDTPSDSLMKYNNIINDGIFTFPVNFRNADNLKIRHYLKIELYHRNITAPFYLAFSTQHIRPVGFNSHYSETNEYSYKYHGFTALHFAGPEFFARAIFKNPQYAILKGMMLVLILSLLLVLFFIYCFNYIIQVIFKQKKLAELKDDFINNMTHELKTPIATLTVAIEGLQKFNALNDPEKTQRYLQTSRNELTRLNDLVNKVLNVAAFEDHELKLLKETVNIDALVEDVISSEKLKTDKNVEINYLNKDHIESIEADKLHLRNVLANLVDNAIKYSYDRVIIDITCARNGNNILFSVKDNGRGIPQSHLDQVFDKFHRVPTGNVHNVKGTGLGLSYVKHIVEAHGGNVNVKSEIDAGSEFTFSIPIS